MIVIVVKFPVRPDRAEAWMSVVADFTAATRAEPGNVFFEWSRGIEDPTEFVLVEAFADADAGAAHVRSEHFTAAMATMAPEVTDVPRIVSVEAPGRGWGRMAELQPVGAGDDPAH